ncbi:MAG: dTDP-4-dehydrorhamnose reductase [Gammaproteobacteria bacterium]|nr:dTDP-4-dehydrorhamnose reductase [Gammaproteobacteria bacterium]MBU1446695.1 dTDP-4-dehydrorhamnose reductase [Gammaproteobacteria bacterium]
MKTILLTGKHGQVGWELQRTLAPLGKVIALDAEDLDLADAEAIRRKVREVQPHIIVNPAAYTAVDKAESEPGLAMAINGIAPGVFAEEAKVLDALLVHYSTDYIFDGSKQGAYVEDDTPNPLGVYGQTKLAGEQAIRAAGCKHLILRTSWVYGARGKNFLLTMLKLAKERSELSIVDDQIGAPTWSRTLGEITAQILSQLHAPGRMQAELEKLYGTYHLTSLGEVSWYGFTTEILQQAAIHPGPALHPIPTSAYPTPAARPRNSRLSNDKLLDAFGLSGGDWQDNLQLCMQELKASARA